MARTTREMAIEQRKTLVEWIVAITTIFWSVWWGFYMQEILPKMHGYVSIPIPFVNPPLVWNLSADFLLTVNALVVSIFAATFVWWLWSVHRTAYRHFMLRTFLRASAPLSFSMMFLLASIGLIGNALGVSLSFMNYGIILTLLWPLVILATIWRT